MALNLWIPSREGQCRTQCLEWARPQLLEVTLDFLNRPGEVEGEPAFKNNQSTSTSQGDALELHMKLVNLYSPNDKTLSLNALPAVEDHYLVVGDFNSHSQNWQDDHRLNLINKTEDHCWCGSAITFIVKFLCQSPQRGTIFLQVEWCCFVSPAFPPGL